MKTWSSPGSLPEGIGAAEETRLGAVGVWKSKSCGAAGVGR